MNPAALTILLAFLVMGVADAMGPLSDAAKERYQISETMATLLPFFVYIAFAVFSIPGGLLAGRIGKKKLLLLGLGLNALAMLVPSVMDPSFEVLLACIFTLGIGTTFLQVAGNPIMRDVSQEGRYSRNLAFAQGFKGLGSASSSFLVSATSLIGFLAALEWRAAFPVFFALMALAFVLVAILKIDESKPDEPPSIGSSLALLKEPAFALAVLGIFLYVGAEASMGRFVNEALENYSVAETSADTNSDANADQESEDAVEPDSSADDESGSDEAAAAKTNADSDAKAKEEDDEEEPKYGAPLFFLLLTIGRLSGGAIVSVVSPQTCLRGSALLGMIGAGLFMFGSQPLAIAGVVCAGLGFANIWPMLFSITVEHRPEKANELSGLMCMAISGGAIVPLIMGQLVDNEWGPKAFIVPTVCFAYLLAISLRGSKPATSAAEA